MFCHRLGTRCFLCEIDRDACPGREAQNRLNKNAGLLKKTDDFVIAVVAYVNGDMAAGEEEKTRHTVDEYMFVVLKAIELPEVYLQ